MAEENPFAAPTDYEQLVREAAKQSRDGTLSPEQQFAPSEHVWRCGDVLVMGSAAQLPRKCIRCNAENDVVMRRRTLSTYNIPLIIVLGIVTGPIIAYFVALAMRQQATVVLGICEPCNQAQKSRSTNGLIMSMGGIALLVVAFIAPLMLFSNTLAQACGIFILFCAAVAITIWGIIHGLRHREIVTIVKIDLRYIWLGDVSPDYLADFPADG